MNDNFYANSHLPNQRVKNKQSFKIPKHNSSWKESTFIEYSPLTSGDVSDSDEEIVIHDVNGHGVRQRGPIKSSSASNLAYTRLRTTDPEVSSDPLLQCDLVPLQLRKDDTLQSISVKYNCSISNIKRANNLISNQEFYGLRELKIPAAKHGILSELIKSGDDPPPAEEKEADPALECRVINVGIGPLLSDSPPNEASEFLKKMDEDIMKIILNTKTQKNSLEEAAAVLSAPTIKPLVSEESKKSSSRKNLCYVLISLLLMSVILPIVIILYMYHVKPSSEDASHYNGTHKHFSHFVER